MKKYDNKSNVTGNLICEHREKLNFSKADVSRKLELLGINMDVTEINRIEKNRQILKDFELIGFIKVLNIELDELKNLIY